MISLDIAVLLSLIALHRLFQREPFPGLPGHLETAAESDLVRNCWRLLVRLGQRARRGWFRVALGGSNASWKCFGPASVRRPPSPVRSPVVISASLRCLLPLQERARAVDSAHFQVRRLLPGEYGDLGVRAK